jgi:hypothetical protein
MNMKFFSLFVIAILALSAVNIVNVSAYSHGDVRANQVGYISTYGGHQKLYYTNNPNVSSACMIGYGDWNFISQTDNWPRRFYDTDRTYSDGSDCRDEICWNQSFNSENTFKFFLSINLWSTTNTWTLDNVDYSKGILVVSDSKNKDQWATVYWTDNYSRSRTSYFEYNH